jgi:hypothetical protein
MLVRAYCKVASLLVDYEISLLEKRSAQHIEVVGGCLPDRKVSSAGVVEWLTNFQVERCIW